MSAYFHSYLCGRKAAEWLIKMKCYQIVELFEEENTAGTKAVADIVRIAEKNEFKPLLLKYSLGRGETFAKIKRHLAGWIRWIRIYFRIEKDSVVLLQEPLRIRQIGRSSILIGLKRRKNTNFIMFVHDVEELRKYLYNKYYEKEFSDMCKVADAIIVHNDSMKKFFIGKGIQEDRIVELGIFDYLQDDSARLFNPPVFEKKIIIAGNLDPRKSHYIGELKKLHNIQIQMYGPNFDSSLKECSNVTYGGCFPSDRIPEKLTAGFGLVWDGDSIDGCKGDAGEYLRYNNPHKLSLYLSSGLPVVIWKEAAEAEFIQNNKLGLTVDSLYDLCDILQNVSEDDYKEMTCNVLNIAQKLRRGYYADMALRKSLKLIEGKAHYER